jgi:NAD(P)-dependent dehydrogenase (short-subunit alcohol dehydrogenase family)
VTGASRGIGRATAVVLAEAGAHVLIHYGRSAQEAESLVAAIIAKGGRANAISADLGTPNGDRQNRLGFVVGLAQQLVQQLPEHIEVKPKLGLVELELEKARLANPGTYCHDSWSKRQRDLTDKRCSALAKHWNLTTGVKLEHLEHYSP